MYQIKKTCIALCAFMLSSAATGSNLSAKEMTFQNAERLIQFNMMVLATHRRCTILKQPYDREFIAFHNILKHELEAASTVVKSNFANLHPDESFDNMLTQTANAYGEGHPKHGCKQLKAEIAGLLKVQSDRDFYATIDKLLIGAPMHNHPQTGSIASKQEENQLSNIATAAEIKSRSGQEPQLQTDQKENAIDKSKEKVGSAVKSGETRDYAGGSRIKDF